MISELSSLRELDISHNKLQELPKGLGEITTLVTLIANDNCLTKLPKSFSSLCHLQHLNLRDNKMLDLPSDIHLLHSLKDINFDGNALVRPPLEVCKGKQMLTITCYLKSADERDEKILESLLKTIASNIPFENFEFFCQKLQLKNDVYKSIVNNRALTIEEKVTQALDYWKTENEVLSPAAMTDQLIRVLNMTGIYYLTNKAKALKLCSRLVKF
ncbi:leucine-rich repeat and death domain-containing protein 1 isoform X3 [Paroedura picta]